MFHVYAWRFKKYYFTHYWCHNLRCSLLDFELNFGRNTQYFNTMRCCTLIYWHNLRELYINSIKRNTKTIRQYHIIDIHWFSKFLNIFPKLTLVPGYLQNAYSALWILNNIVVSLTMYIRCNYLNRSQVCGINCLYFRLYNRSLFMFTWLFGWK